MRHYVFWVGYVNCNGKPIFVHLETTCKRARKALDKRPDIFTHIWKLSDDPDTDMADAVQIFPEQI